MATVEQVIALAASHIGVRGTNNRFNTWYWGHPCYDAAVYPWCAAYQSYVADQAGGLGYYYSASVSGICSQLERIPDAQAGRGDYVAFNWDGRRDTSWMDHIGIVEWFDHTTDYFGTIEGNTGSAPGGECMRMTRYNEGSYFTAFYRPKYASPEPEKPKWSGEEVSGANRVETAKAIAEKKGITGRLLQTPGDGFADPLTAMWAAGRLDANILFGGDGFYLNDGKGGVYLGSDDRYGTNRLFIEFWEKAKGLDPGDTCLVVPGGSFADGIACAWASYNEGMPIILHEESEDFARLVSRFGNVIVVGNTVPRLDAETERIAGHDRAATAAAVAERFGQTWGQPVICTGWGFPDAVASAQWVGNDVLLFSEGQSTIDALKRHKGEITKLYFIGDENAISDQRRHELSVAAGLL